MSARVDGLFSSAAWDGEVNETSRKLGKLTMPLSTPETVSI